MSGDEKQESDKLVHSMTTENDQRDKLCIFPPLNHDGTSEEGHATVQDIAVESWQTQTIDELCESNSTDLVHLLFAVWSLVLYRYSETEQLYFGVDVPPAWKESESVLGSISDGEQIAAVAIDAGAPINRLLQFNVYNVYPRAEDDIHFNTAIRFVGSEQRCTICSADTQTRDVVLIVQKTPETLKLLLQYNTAMLSSDQASYVAGAVTQALRCFQENSAQRAKDASLVDEKSRDRIARWNNNRSRHRAYNNRSIVGIISERSRSQPGAQAVCSWDGSLTYAELEDYSSRLAAHLKRLGIGDDVMVPLCFEKSVWAIVATLAVLKTRAAFVPLDASHPLRRLNQIIAQVKATSILVSECHAALLADSVERVISISESTVRSLPQPDGIEHERLSPLPLDVAYVLFTSGSTGSPKGCVVEHRALAGVVEHGEALGIVSGSRALQFASYIFGFSLVEIFCTLTVGGTICIPSESERLNDLVGAVQRMAVNWAALSPSLVNSLNNPDTMSSLGLKTLAVCGEPVNKHVLQTWADKIRLVQPYGFTEWAGVCAVQRRMTPATSPNNVGTSPSANLWLVLPDNHDVLAPIGAVAELLVEGPCLARGYLDNAERTAAMFIENPAWLQHYYHASSSNQQENPRFYKTGDLVRYEADGSIHYVARKDTQAKLRGQRIELGEVEHHVRRCFGARNVVAEVVTPTEGRAPLLVAFVLIEEEEEEGEGEGEGEESKEATAFRAAIPAAEARLYEAVPAYMVPAAFLPLATLPRTATGKTDRRRLRERAAALSQAQIQAYAVPPTAKRQAATAAERSLQGLWARVLNLPPDAIGADDSFFRLGGDSLAAMQVATLSRSAGLNISVADIFKHRQLSLICRNLSQRATTTTSTYESPLAPQPFSLAGQDISFTELASLSPLIDPGNVVDVVPATEDQRWFLTQWSSSLFSFLLSGQVTTVRLQRAVEQLVEKHSVLRTVFCEYRSTIVQVVLERSLPCFEHIHTDESLDSVFRDLSDKENGRSSLGAQPFKVMLVSRSSEEHMLVVRLSHAQHDGYSIPGLLQDLATAYNQHRLPVSTATSFSDYVYYRRQRRSESTMRFWREQLQSSRIATIPFPAAARASTDTSSSISIRERASITLPPLPQDTTYPTLVNAAVSLILSKLMDSRDVAFGLVVNTRSLPMQGIDSILGPCISHLPFRVLLQQSQSIDALCMHVRDQYANLLDHCHSEKAHFADGEGGSVGWPTVPESAPPFGCIVNHISADRNWKDLMSLDGLSCPSFSRSARINLQGQVLIRSLVDGEELCIEVLTSAGAKERDCSAKFARALASAVLFTVEQFAEKFHSPLSSIAVDLDSLAMN